MTRRRRSRALDCPFFNAVVCFVAALGGVSCVSGNRCNVSEVSPCYNSLVHYEGLGFPLYGHDDVALDETCR